MPLLICKLPSPNDDVTYWVSGEDEASFTFSTDPREATVFEPGPAIAILAEHNSLQGHAYNDVIKASYCVVKPKAVMHMQGICATTIREQPVRMTTESLRIIASILQGYNDPLVTTLDGLLTHVVLLQDRRELLEEFIDTYGLSYSTLIKHIDIDPINRTVSVQGSPAHE